MNSPAVIREWIREAEAQRHRLHTGKAARVVVDQSGERLEFLSTKLGDLDDYIASLHEQLRIACGGRRRVHNGFRF